MAPFLVRGDPLSSRKMDGAEAMIVDRPAFPSRSSGARCRDAGLRSAVRSPALRPAGRRFFGAESFDESCGIKSLDALLHGEHCPDLENQRRGFTTVAPIIQQSRLKQMLEQCSAKEDGIHIRTGSTLLRDRSRIDAYPGSVIGDRFLHEIPNALQVIRIHRKSEGSQIRVIQIRSQGAIPH